MEMHHLFPWIYGVFIFCTLILIYIKVKTYERLSKKLSKLGGLKDELIKYQTDPNLYFGEFKVEIQKALGVRKILNIVVVLLLVFVGVTFIYFNLKFKGTI